MAWDCWGLQAVYSLAFPPPYVLCEFLLLLSVPLQSQCLCPSGLHLSFCSSVPDFLCLSLICFLLLDLCSRLSNSVLLL